MSHLRHSGLSHDSQIVCWWLSLLWPLLILLVCHASSIIKCHRWCGLTNRNVFPPGLGVCSKARYEHNHTHHPPKGTRILYCLLPTTVAAQNVGSQPYHCNLCVQTSRFSPCGSMPILAFSHGTLVWYYNQHNNRITIPKATFTGAYGYDFMNMGGVGRSQQQYQSSKYLQSTIVSIKA